MPVYKREEHGGYMTRVIIAVAFVLAATTVDVAAGDLQQAVETSSDRAEAAATRFFPDRHQTRGSLLPVLYGSLAGLEALDGYSTLRGVATGAQEANPLMRGAVRNPAAFWIAKGGVAALSIAVSERLWRHHRGRAVATMLITNGVM